MNPSRIYPGAKVLVDGRPAEVVSYSEMPQDDCSTRWEIVVRFLDDGMPMVTTDIRDLEPMD